jgi:hypothetical protein
MLSRLRKPRVLVLCATLLLVTGAAGFGAYTYFFRHNLAASCSNCRRFASAYLDEYALKHGGWYPKGAGSPMHSLALTIADIPEKDKMFSVHFFTSHALEKQALDYYEQYKTFHENYSCYRYNEGLNATDREMILLYYFEPTRWECSDPRHRAKFIGRNVLTGGMWDFIPEAEFQRRQAATLTLLASREKPTRSPTLSPKPSS